LKKGCGKELDNWIKECDVDGRMICFEFFDSDIEDLKNCIKRDNQKAKEIYEKKFEEFIKKLKKIKLTGMTMGEKMMIDWFKQRIDKLSGEIRWN